MADRGEIKDLERTIQELWENEYGVRRPDIVVYFSHLVEHKNTERFEEANFQQRVVYFFEKLMQDDWIIVRVSDFESFPDMERWLIDELGKRILSK